MDANNTNSQPNASALNIGPQFFNALCWVNQTTFPADLERGLLELGTDPVIAKDISMSYRFSQIRNFMHFYEEYAYSVGSKDWQEPLAAYISARLAEYDRYGKHELPMADYLRAQLALPEAQ